MIRFFVPGVPVPQPRPRATARLIREKDGKIAARAWAYAPKDADTWKAAVVWNFRKVWHAIPMDGPLSVSTYFYLPRAKTVKRRLPATRPDFDNLIKAVVDALNGIAWRDDGQIVRWSGTKLYATENYPAGVVVEVDAVDFSLPGEVMWIVRDELDGSQRRVPAVQGHDLDG